MFLILITLLTFLNLILVALGISITVATAGKRSSRDDKIIRTIFAAAAILITIEINMVTKL